MSKFKKFMRGAMSLILYMAIASVMGYWGWSSLVQNENVLGNSMWVLGLIMLSGLVWMFLVFFLVWLTDGKWELEDEESEDED